jgi:hypothetical protein
MMRLRLAVAAFALSLVLALSTAGAMTYVLTSNTTSTKDFATDLRNGLVQSCKVNGNPLREAVQDQLREQIHQRENLDYARFFPNVPFAELKALLEQQNRADRATLKKIAPVDCSRLYPKP